MNDTRSSASTVSDEVVGNGPSDISDDVSDSPEAVTRPEPLVIPDDEPHAEAGEAAEAPAEPAVVGQGDVEVDCPGCGLAVVGDSPRPTAAWFCPRCDYPLFWVSEPPAATPPNRRARRRLPGTGGTVVLGAEQCWHCGEMNEPAVVECIRCAATLPKPVPPAVPVIREAVRVPTPVAVRFVTWPYIAAGTCAGGAIAMALTMWATGG